MAASGFTWKKRKNGDVAVTHHGTVAAVLRGPKAQDFLQDVDGASKQECQDLMARLTGNYKRGNEREARNHPRSR